MNTLKLVALAGLLGLLPAARRQSSCDGDPTIFGGSIHCPDGSMVVFVCREDGNWEVQCVYPQRKLAP